MASTSEMHAIEAGIADFIRDPARSSMELPPMTAAERKHAKLVLEQYPDLACESYGFGKERTLHLFKKAPSSKPTMSIQELMMNAATNKVNVKNTFIDDWASTESEPIILRSMPANLPRDTVKCVMDGPVCKLDLSLVRDSDCSTVAPSSCVSDDGSTVPTPRTSLPDWFRLPPGLELEVKNTFVHFSGPSADERAVQSMPRSMFRRSLLLESLLEEPAKQNQEEAVTSRPYKSDLCKEEPSGHNQEEAVLSQPYKSDASDDDLLSVGAEVVIEGLSKSPAYNGIAGTVEFFDAQSGRYSVSFSNPVSGRKSAMLKRENCRLLSMQVGTEVVIEGLSKCPAFNGLQGTVQSYDSQSGRYKIVLSSPELGSKTAMLKRENCRLVSFTTDAEVVIEGLTKFPAFNGLRGRVQSLEVQSGRYNILLSSPVHGCRSTMVKPENLRLIPDNKQ